jgi:outer membrane receptor protein involved in Fe transport
MKKFGLLSTSAIGSVAFIGFAIATPASAQTGGGDPQAAQACENLPQGPDRENCLAAHRPDANTPAAQSGDQAIVVTGTRIARPNLVSTIPITSVTGAELEQTGRVAIGDVLNDLPQLASTFSQANSTRFLGTGGLNLLDLRGLGTQRTLVLVNGRRHVGSDILNNAVSPDVNTFPTDLIERVDVVTGGNSAVYGSDAIAGVVNFILKDHFDGVQVHAQGAISQYGDAGSYYASLLAGHNFAGGRGNVAVDFEYARQQDFFASDRNYLSQTNTFLTVGVDSCQKVPGVPPGDFCATPNNNGSPDAVFFKDVRVATFSDTGLVSIFDPHKTGACGTGSGSAAVPPATFSCDFIFSPDGNAGPETGTRVGVGSGTSTPSGSFIGGNGNTRREGSLLQLLPQLDRYSANLIGHFDISDALVPFVEASFSRTDSFSQGGSGPAFFTGSTIDGFFERPRLDNPYLSADAKALLSNELLSVVNPGGVGFNPACTTVASCNTPLTAAQQASLISQIQNGSYRFILRKNLTDLGTRSEAARRDTYRIVGGLRGTFNDDWRYELSVNYGEFDERTKVTGNVNVPREILALDAVRNSSGQIVCGAQLNPADASAGPFGGAIGWNGDPLNLISANIAACQPLDPFGTGNVSQAAKNYILQDTTSVGKITQFDVLGFIAGDTSKFFNLWGGPIGFSVGAEYRRETNFFQEDPLVENGYTFYNAIAKFAPPSFEVKEAFGEIRLPVLKDMPFAQTLEIDAAARVSDYKGSAGTVWAYNVGGDYAPVRDIRFRANYARAVRAPNLSDLFSPQSQNFAPGFGDPCSAINISSGTQFRAANCAAAGAPAGYDFRYAQSLEIVSGGNPNLKVETSDSYTYGVVLQPRWIPGLSISADYFNINVKNVITAPSAQGIVNSCYDGPTLNPLFCSLFQRAGAGGGPNGEEPFRIIEGSLQQTLLNYANFKTRGIDFELGYNHRFGGISLSSRLTYTHNLENDTFTDPTQPGFGNTVVGELGFPKDEVSWNTTADFGQWFFNWQMHYLGKQAVGSIEDQITFEGRPPQNLDDFDIPFYPAVLYMDARIGVNITKGSNFYIGIDNLSNQIPPLGATGTGGGSAIFDSIGRRFYAGITAKF